ncbi:hypothetical protein [Notoacmeibacter sp. MSK16QG-6]|uniref:hypothetical protein n=1 Tax=Notoacmeibacter sp. MSK16QG-6 TaxID=2957982 RepID=UPI00209D936D|nr:hypothetical protein [Notoacmeibacter sp. MSK16QG-6]MCP1200889.1 hypothetical protein [Notoacmeibacter sp. MSK16QG-6]
MWQSLLFGLLGIGGLAAGLVMSVPQPSSEMLALEANIDKASGGHEEVASGTANIQSAESRDLPVLVAPLISPNGEIVGYQSLALSVVLPTSHDAGALRPLQFAIEDSFNEWIATSSDEDRRTQFDDLFTLADYLEKRARERFNIEMKFDLVALQSDIFAAAETRQNLIEPKGGAKPSSRVSSNH